MRKIGLSFSLVIALMAMALLIWALIHRENGYALASAMLCTSAIYAAIRGPDMGAPISQS